MVNKLFIIWIFVQAKQVQMRPSLLGRLEGEKTLLLNGHDKYFINIIGPY